MSGIEIFGAISGALGVIEQSIKLYNRVKNAKEARKDHVKNVQRHLDGLERTSELLKLVNRTEVLKTPFVAECAASIKKRSEELNTFLQDFLEKKGGFWHIFRSGEEDNKKLEKKMSDLQMAKQDLDGAILCVNVGLTGDIHQNQATADTKLIADTNAEVQKVMGKKSELNITKVVKDKIPNENGKVSMNQSDLDNLARSAKAKNGRKITVQKNITRDLALQFNAPIGTDLWKDINELSIEFNEAEDQSRQFNYAQTMDVYLDQMAKGPKPLDYSLFAILVAIVAVLYILYGK